MWSLEQFQNQKKTNYRKEEILVSFYFGSKLKDIKCKKQSKE